MNMEGISIDGSLTFLFDLFHHDSNQLQKLIHQLKQQLISVFVIFKSKRDEVFIVDYLVKIENLSLDSNAIT